MVKQKCFALKKFYFRGTLISSISLEQEFSAMVKEKCLYIVLLYRNSDIFYFSAIRNQCNSETEMFCFEKVFWFEENLLHRNSNTFYFSATRNQCNGEIELFCFEDVLLHRNSVGFYFFATRNQCNDETEMSS